MDEIACRSDVLKIKSLITSCRQKTLPARQGGIVKEYNAPFIIFSVFIIALWLFYAYSGYLVMLWYCCFATIIYAIAWATLSSENKIIISRKKEIPPSWENDFLKEGEFEVVSTCSDYFKKFLLSKMNNDLTQLTVSRLESIIDEYSDVIEKDLKKENAEKLSKHLLKISS